MPLTATHLGPYEILSQIGAGGMGEVYQARDQRLDRTVALKVLPADLASDPDRMMRFTREAKAASALSNPNVAHIYDIGEADGISFIAMEYVEGQRLDAKINGRPLQVSQIVEIGIQIADALEEAHSKGITHRDIKPGNIIITPRGQVKVLDFGLAKIAKQPITAIASNLDTAAKTDRGVILGTVQYMSPEQALAKEMDHRTDIFSQGVVLYEMTTGRLPFIGASASQTLDRIIHNQPDAISRFNSNVPLELERIIRKCLEKDRDRRYQSARDLQIDLNNLKRDTESGAIRPAPRALPLKTAAIIALLLIAGLGTYFLVPWEKPIDSLAILPFANLSDDPNQQYLSDSITDALIDVMSRKPKLRVMALSTVFGYKGKEVDARKIGQDLKVGAVLTGKVLQEPGKITVQAELINSVEGTHLWGEKYEGRLSDIQSMQSQISNEVSEKLGLKPDVDRLKPGSKISSAAAEAYPLYLKGRYLWNNRTPADLQKAIDLFHEALQKDPNNALAYSGLADSYTLHAGGSDEERQKAKAAARKALELDDHLAEAHNSTAAVKDADWDFSGAETEYKRAIELNPKYVTAHQWYGEHLVLVGQFRRGIMELSRAQELDPGSVLICTLLGRHYYYAGDYDAALDQYQRALNLSSGLGLENEYAELYGRKGMYKESIEQYQKALRAHPEGAAVIGADFLRIGYEKALSNMWKRSRYWYQQVSNTEDISPALFVEFAALLRENDHAFELMEEMYTKHVYNLPDTLVYLRLNPRTRSISEDPRYVDLMRRVGLPLKWEYLKRH